MRNKQLSIAIFAEFSAQIGTGHIIESFNLAKAALRKGFNVSIWISQGIPLSILDRAPCHCNFFHSLKTKKECDGIRDRLSKDKSKVIVFNFRKITNKTLSFFRSSDSRLVCIDELGNRYLNCDAIINTSIVKRYHHYYSNDNNFTICAGPEYLSVSAEFTKIHPKKRTFNNGIRSIAVSMSGLDSSGTTLKIINALVDWKPDVKKNILLGGGFIHSEEVTKKTPFFKDNNFRIYHNASNLESLLLESDVAFTAGGNTLYELACIGTPAIVLYEDEHERESGVAFEKHGFGYCLGRGVDVGKKNILSVLEKFEDAKVRYMHSFRGKKIVDGKGSHRILKIVERLARDDRAVKEGLLKVRKIRK